MEQSMNPQDIFQLGRRASKALKHSWMHGMPHKSKRHSTTLSKNLGVFDIKKCDIHLSFYKSVVDSTNAMFSISWGLFIVIKY